ncbi:helix-turn-helix transcriptional regulator [Streptosporangium sp. NPDC023963]|uniref:helix-turn-helix domain-containing protein n=1 Tax=Streptosporangium sp. NPDC023963 TaxID=3155608 RepID=UPI003435F358
MPTLRRPVIRQPAERSPKGLALAVRYGWQASKVSKLENGRQTPSETDIQAWCEAVERPDEAPNLISTLRAMETLMYPGAVQRP